MKFLSIALLLVATGCGSSQPNPSINSMNQTTPCYGYSNYGYNNYNPCYTNYNNYANGTQVAPGVYVVQVPLYTNDFSINGSQLTVSLTPSVNAGDRISTVSLNSLYLYRTCGNGFFSISLGANTFPLMSPAIAVNGTVIASSYSGMAIAPAAGTASMFATVYPSGSCVGSTHWSLGSAYGYGSYQAPVAYINRCVNTSGASVQCP